MKCDKLIHECVTLFRNISEAKNKNRFVCRPTLPNRGRPKFFYCSSDKFFFFPFCICGKSGFVLFRFYLYFIVTGTCSRFSEVLVYYMHIFSPKKKKRKKKRKLPTYPPLLSMGRPTAIKDLFKSGLILYLHLQLCQMK